MFIPKDLNMHVLKNYSVAHLQPYVNMRTLIGHHLGLKGKGSIENLLAEGDSRTTQLYDFVTSFLESKH